MVYKPKKTVNGHKRNDRYTRRRKARDARKRRAAARPVRSNIKRYVAEQFGKTHPDNRYYLALPAIKPTNTLADTPRYYPFGANFQKEFLNMEFKRMKEVVTQFPAQRGIIGGVTSTEAATTSTNIGNFNHWKSLLGRGIHMKNSTVYGTIRLNELVYLQQMDILKYGNLKLHMFVLEDKAVTKTEFLNWYKDFLSSSSASETARDIQSTDGPVTNGVYDKDILKCPYVAQSRYVNSNAGVGGAPHTVSIRPDGGFDEFLIDWEKFYVPTADNPSDSLFYNEVKCTTSWDGSRDNSILPVNKSRFIVHEHKTWSFKPKANGCLNTVIPFEYSFPEHYMSYDKELLDMPFCWNSTAATDDQGLDVSWLYPRKQPYIVFVYTCDNPHLIDAPTFAHRVTAHAPTESDFIQATGNKPVIAGDTTGDNSSTAMDTSGFEALGVNPSIAAEQRTGDLRTRVVEADGTVAHNVLDVPTVNGTTTFVPKGDVFSIDMHFKCSYENKLATSIVPTINKGRPIIHKRESPPKRTRPAARPRKSHTSKNKSRQSALPEWMKGKKPDPKKSGVQRDAGPSKKRGVVQRDAGPSKKTKLSPSQFHPSVDKEDRSLIHEATQWLHDNPIKRDIGIGVITAALSIVTFGAADAVILGGAFAEGGMALAGRVFTGKLLEKAAPILARRGYTQLATGAERGVEMALAEETAAGQYVRTATARRQYHAYRSYEPFTPGLMSMH